MQQYYQKAKLFGKALQRKGVSATKRSTWIAYKKFINSEKGLISPPIIVSSLPKSGTHLLLQVIETLPGVQNFGQIIATRASYSRQMRSPNNIKHRINGIMYGEVVGAQLPYAQLTHQFMKDRGALHFFIYRDPRAVLVSEIEYLVNMAPWNILHKRFLSQKTFEERINLGIYGDGTPELPNIIKRFQPYYDWIGRQDTIAINFDDLNSIDTQKNEIKKICHHYFDIYQNKKNTLSEMDIIENLNRGKKHTCTGLDPQRWRSLLTQQQQSFIIAQFPIFQNLRS